MKALVLAGGSGSRLRPLTHTFAKQLLPIANKPIIHYVLEDLQSAGITQVVMIVGKETQADVCQELGDGRQWGLSIVYVYQDQPLGLAHCVALARDALGDDRFVMYLGDNLLRSGIASFVPRFANSNSDALALFCEVPNASEFGVAEFASDGSLVRLLEKPPIPPSNKALIGVYFFGPRIFEAVNSIQPSRRNELEITDAIQWLMDNGGIVDHVEVDGWWKDTGKPHDVLEANRLVLRDLTESIDPASDVDGSSKVLGEVHLGPNVVIRNSVIRGPTVIGAGTTVTDATVGPFTSVGAACKIQNAEISYSIVMEDSQIEDVDERIDWSLIGRGVQIFRTLGKPKGLNFVLGDRSQVGLT